MCLESKGSSTKQHQPHPSYHHHDYHPPINHSEDDDNDDDVQKQVLLALSVFIYCRMAPMTALLENQTTRSSSPSSLISSSSYLSSLSSALLLPSQLDNMVDEVSDNGRACTEAEDDDALGRNQWLMGGSWPERGRTRMRQLEPGAMISKASD